MSSTPIASLKTLC